jgi:hypothetical protein
MGMEDEVAAYLSFASQQEPEDKVQIILAGTLFNSTTEPRPSTDGPQTLATESQMNPVEKTHKTAKNTTQASNRPIQHSRLLLLPRELKDMFINSVESQQDLYNLS